MKWTGVLLVALTVMGCRSAPFVGRTTTGRDPNWVERGALERASADLACGPEELVVLDLGAGGFRVDGCGQTTSYTCLRVPNGGLRGGVVCSPNARAAVVLVAQPTVQPAVQPASQPAAQPVPAWATAPDTAIDAARSVLTSRAPSVLACVPDAAIALDASWDTSGALSVSLTGPRAGSPEEACVRAAYVGVTVSPAGEGGRVIHPIQR